MMNESTKMIIVSNVLKKQCKEYGISQRQICEKTELSKQYVSAFFSGDAVLNASFINQVIRMINPDRQFNFNESYLGRARDFLKDYLTEYCYLTDDYYLNKMKDYLSEDMLYSLACPEYLALNCAFRYKKKGLISTKEWIEMIDSHFIKIIKTNKEAYLLFLLIKTEIQMDEESWRSALLTLEEAKEQASSCLNGILYLFEGICYSELNDCLTSIICLQNAEELLLRARNYNRTLAASKNLGTSFTRMNQFALAEKQLKKVLIEAKRLNRHDMVDVCNVSLTNALFQQRKFAEAIEYGNQVSNNYKRKLHYIHLAWSYYYLNKLSDAKKIIDKMMISTNDTYYQKMKELICMYINDDESSKKIQKLNEMIEISLDTASDVLWCNKLLIAEYEKNQDYENIAKCQKKILANLGYVSFADRK